jgi:hypothetical protein
MKESNSGAPIGALLFIGPSVRETREMAFPQNGQRKNRDCRSLINTPPFFIKAFVLFGSFSFEPKVRPKRTNKKTSNDRSSVHLLEVPSC